ncbi:MAG TPA: hypothetical protein VN969_47655 [Streptosporangiaceae bacterium]|nr:hypothetical protein [Streptosporangiaceae bacterium]
MRFGQRLREGIHDGSITVTFRRWKRHQVVPRGRYRTGAGLVEVDTVDVIDPARISRADARPACPAISSSATSAPSRRWA